MSFDSESFEKYSFIGSFENQMKLSIAMANSPSFNMESHLLECNRSMGWYTNLLENLTKNSDIIHAFAADDDPLKTPTDNFCDKIINETTSKLSQAAKSPSNHSTTSNTATPNAKKSTNNIILKNYHSMNRHWTQDDRTLTIMKHWYPFKFKLAYPRFSSLDSNQQKEYLDLNAVYGKNNDLVKYRSNNYKRYTYFKRILDTEREEFNEYLKKYFDAAYSEDYQYIDQNVMLYTDELIRLLEKNSMNYDRFYKQVEKLTLFNDNTKNLMKFDKLLVQLGKVPTVNVPNINSASNLPELETKFSVLNKRIPVSRAYKTYQKIQISKDDNAKKLANKYQANFVMTSSTFESLLNQYENDDEYLVPFRVQEVTLDDGSIHKIVFIEKPFIKKNLSKREKNEKFFKKSLICSFTKEQTGHAKRFGKRKLGEATEEQPLQKEKEELGSKKKEITEKFETESINYESISNIETFGFENLTQQRRKSESEGPTAMLTSKTGNSKTSIQMTVKENILEKKAVEKKKVENSEDEESMKLRIDESRASSVDEIKETQSTEDESSENEDDEFESHLVIDVPENNDDDMETRKIKKIQKPNLILDDIEDVTGPASPEKDTELGIDTSSADNTMLANPKVIPLDKPFAESQNEMESLSATSQTPNYDKIDDPTSKKPTLNELMSKIHDKLKSSVLTDTLSFHYNPLSVPSVSKIQPSENSSEYKPVENIHYNINYSLWTFDHGCKVLIRWSNDGVILNENGIRENVCLMPKLEYQPQFGCEKLTKEEYCKMWTKSYLKNYSDVLLCRINVFTNQLILVTKLKHNEILTHDCGFNPFLAMNHVFTLFTKLYSFVKQKSHLSFQPANYLLSKQPKEANSYVIMKSTENKHNAIDLHFRCIGFDNVIERGTRWRPVDCEILLPYHQILKRVPCTFEPTQVSPKKKKNKKKNKKKDNQNKNV